MWGWGLRTIQHLSGRRPLASQREAGVFTAKQLSLVSVLWPDTCSLLNDETPEAEPGNDRGNACPRAPVPGAKSRGPFLARPLSPDSAGERVPVPTQLWRPFPSPPDPRETTCSPVHCYDPILQIRKLKIMPLGRQIRSKIETPFPQSIKGLCRVSRIAMS